MSSEKTRKGIYLTPTDSEKLAARANNLSMFQSGYIAELIMWDNQLKLIERCRDGKIKAVET